MRATWTDSRLDDFAANTDRRFEELSDRVGDLADRMDRDFREIRTEIGSLQRTIIQVGGSLAAGFVGLIAAVLALVATQI